MPIVTFKVQGGHTIGMGHVFRSLCLADTLKMHGMIVQNFFCNDDEASIELIRDRGYNVNPYNLGKPNYRELWREISHNMPAVLVLDQPESEPALLAMLKNMNNNLFIAALDCFDMDEEHLDLMVNLFNHNRFFNRPKSNNVTYVEGLNYAIIRKSFDKFIGSEKTIQDHATDVLVSFGGADACGNTFRVLDALLTSNKRHKLFFHVVIGPSFMHKKSINEMGRKLKDVVALYYSPENIEELMFSCDFGLIGAGTMMMEMAAIGTPSIVLPQNENENRFGRLFATKGLVLLPDSDGFLSNTDLLQSIFNLSFDAGLRRRMSIAGKHLIDGKGRFRIADMLKQGMNKSLCHAS